VTAIGRPADNQGLTQPVARCDGTTCSVLVGVRNEAPRPVRERLLVARGGTVIAARTLTAGAGATTDVAIAAEPGARLTLRLDRADALPGDDRATVTVPDASAPLRVTLVSADAATPVARGLSALPGVRVHRVAPADYAGADGAALLVLDRFVPPDRLPDVSTLIVAPPSLPGGHVGPALADPALTGAVPGNALLDGVDLGGLVVAPGGVHRIALPPTLPAIAWAAGGPLLADDGHTTLLAIDPARSNLAQLPAFPVLLANVAARARGDVAAPAPPAAPAALTLRAADGGARAPGSPTDWWPWLVATALLVLLAETALTAEWHFLPAGRARNATRRVRGR